MGVAMLQMPRPEAPPNNYSISSESEINPECANGHCIYATAKISKYTAGGSGQPKGAILARPISQDATISRGG